MAGRLDGKKALVTGAAQGIGRATTVAFAREGASVVATDRTYEALESLKGTKNVDIAKLDVCSNDDVKSVVDKFGPFDVVFNCAGIVDGGSITETTEEQLWRAFEVNVAGTFRVTQAAIKGMIERGGGSIINIASVASSRKGVPNRCAYGTSKAAVIGLTKSVAADYVGQGVRCNAICPGTVDSPSLQGRINALPNPEQARRDFVARQPMGRLGTAEEIAALGVYLASSEGGFATGAAFDVDGGMTI